MLFARQHDMIFRWGCEPFIIDKGVQGGHDILDHPGPLQRCRREWQTVQVHAEAALALLDPSGELTPRPE